MHSPRKRFGQHFLHDQAVIQHIVAALDPVKNEHLIEIGPGQGALTLPVLKRVGQLEAVELDRDILATLKERTQRAGELHVYSADVLEFDFAAIHKDNRQLRVFGNLPYNISTPLIFHLLTFANIIEDMVFMLQKEVALRLAAAPRSEDYGRLSIMVQYHCETDLLFDVSPEAFFPPPKVMSSIIRLVPYKDVPYPAHDYALFASIVKQAFGQRRKTLRNSLKKMVDDAMWEQLQLHSDQRPEELHVKDFVAISNWLSTHPVKES